MVPDRLLSACIVALYAWAMGSMAWTGDAYRVVGVADVPFVAAAAVAASLVALAGFAGVIFGRDARPPRTHTHTHTHTQAQAQEGAGDGEKQRPSLWMSTCLYALVALPPCAYLIDWYLRLP